MGGRNIIVVGASAGGVEALSHLVSRLPAGFPATIFVVVHFPPHGTSVLPDILRRAGKLRVSHAADGDAIEPGTVVVAPPDHHLLVKPGHVRLTRGPRENGHRPAADALFRTAARAYGRRVIGVVLTGNMDDGTAGLAAVARMGGVAVAQDPEDALYAGMPASAVANVDVDHVVPLEGLAELLVRLVEEPADPSGEEEMPGEIEIEADMAEMDPDAFDLDDRPGTPSGFTCPECHGALWELAEDGAVRFRCRVGHAYGAETLLAEQTSSVEAALWTALKALKERAVMARQMARRMEGRGNARSTQRFDEQARDADEKAAVIREVLRAGLAEVPAAPSLTHEPAG